MDEKDYPGLYQAADIRAGVAQKAFLRLTIFYISVLVVGAFLSTYSQANLFYAWFAALLFLASLFLTVFMAVKKYDGVWYRARAVAESVKTRSWRYIMRSKPYDREDSDASKLFLKDLKHILEENQSLSAELINASTVSEAISNNMVKTRNLSLADRIKFYKEYRINEQKDWYHRKSVWNKKKFTMWTIGIFGFQCLALLFIMIRISQPKWDKLPTEVVLTITACIMTWVQIKRFSELASSYGLTAHEIAIIGSLAQEFKSEEDFSTFVNDAENAFSREHTQWVARRDAR